jgi:hypothetical protein
LTEIGAGRTYVICLRRVVHCTNIWCSVQMAGTLNLLFQ